MPESSHIIESLPILILYPHSRCNCRCVMCDIWKVTTVEEISAAELEGHAADLKSLAVRWVVFSGGEPLMHGDLFRLAGLLRRRQIRTSVLTTGLLLERDAARIAESIDDVIVSLDGPPAIHDKIRRVPEAFARLEAGLRALHALRPDYPVSTRCTVQRDNHLSLRQTVETAKNLGLYSVSFLAADLTSTAFNRPDGWLLEKQAEVGLSRAQTDALEGEVEALIRDYGHDIEAGFIRETPEKLRRLARHFRAHLGLVDPVSPPCNAPWVSAVIEADGTVRPCFFHRPIGNTRRQGLREVINSPEAVTFRAGLDIASNPVCRRCVCSLHWPTGTS